MAAEQTAAHGNVTNQDKAMDVITPVLALPLTRPIPNNEPTATWVVETGSPSLLAKITNSAVTKLADKPCSCVMRVILWLMVSATRNALNTPPSSMNNATAIIIHCRAKLGASNNKAAIFGVSLRPRAKQTVPALQKCRPSRRHRFSAVPPSPVPLSRRR